MPKANRPGTLASKAANQYRGRDVFAYLGLRYCFESNLAKTDKWAEQIATQIIFGSSKAKYLTSYHFKEVDSDGAVQHRKLYVPTPSEALSEAVILSACAEVWERESCPAFSYRPSKRDNRQSYYINYMEGLRTRHDDIAAACEKNPDSFVQYLDIKSFYPSITINLARSSWRDFCDRHEITQEVREIGSRLIYNYDLKTDGKSILTGPMFCHFLANLALKSVDDIRSEIPAQYLRYVDDITLVGSRAEIAHSIPTITKKLSELGFTLHSPNDLKSIEVCAAEWMKGARDFKDGVESLGWMKLVGDIKKFLIFNSKDTVELDSALCQEGFRFPLPDYSASLREISSFEKVRLFNLWGWLFQRSRGNSIDRILRSATQLRDKLEIETFTLLEQKIPIEQKFERKRIVSKLRYRIGRLLYLSSSEKLGKIEQLASGWPELYLHTALMRSINSRDCSELIELGSNAAQAGAQLFRAMSETAIFSQPVTSEWAVQGLAVFILNGVSVEAKVASENHPLLRFSRGPVDIDLMQQPRGLLQELACLHGLGCARHSELLRSAFDATQEISFDALEFDYGYYV
jgi:hypothetical protein